MHIQFVTDAQYVMNVIFAIDHPVLFRVCPKVANLDIIDQIRPLWDTHRFFVTKVKSHREFESAIDLSDLFCIMGNHCADLAATAVLQKIPNV